MSKNEDLRIAPLKNYTPPSIPTLAEAGSQSTLKTLPTRWRKNAVVMACLGLGVVGAIMISGCGEDSRQHRGGAAQAPFYVAQPTERETLAQIQAKLETANIEYRTHHGGAVGIPMYVAYITEHEVLGFVRASLEAAGLNFDNMPLGYNIFGESDDVLRSLPLRESDIDLFDAENRVAIANLSRDNSAWPCSRADWINRELSQHKGDITIGVFYSPGQTFDPRRFRRGVSRRAREAARPNLIRDLTTQVDDFIARLQAEGII